MTLLRSRRVNEPIVFRCLCQHWPKMSNKLFVLAMCNRCCSCSITYQSISSDLLLRRVASRAVAWHCAILSCAALRCAAPRRAAPRRAMLCHAVRCHAVRCHAVRCGAVLCGAVRCDAVRCGAVPCRAVTWPAPLQSAQSLGRQLARQGRPQRRALSSATRYKYIIAYNY